MIVWRISNYATLDGMGGMLRPGRWHSKGNPIVYCADHPASCLLELLVNTDPGLLPDAFQLLKIELPKTTRPINPKLDDDWMDHPATTRHIGDTWLRGQASLLLRVPSSILPEAVNVLFNPLHPMAKDAKILSSAHVPLDHRLR